MNVEHGHCRACAGMHVTTLDGLSVDCTHQTQLRWFSLHSLPRRFHVSAFSLADVSLIFHLGCSKAPPLARRGNLTGGIFIEQGISRHVASFDDAREAVWSVIALHINLGHTSNYSFLPQGSSCSSRPRVQAYDDWIHIHIHIQIQ